MQRRGLLGTLLQGMCGVNFIWRRLTDTIDLPTFCTCGGKSTITLLLILLGVLKYPIVVLDAVC